LAAVLRAVSLHGDLLRASVAVPGNDHRLGANEAPPAIISVYLGEQLTQVIDNLIAVNSGNSTHNNETSTNNHSNGEKQLSDKLEMGVKSLPILPRDTSDRNRTSPFAFTGNKFEFRAVGSGQSCAKPVTFLNCVMAESLHAIATQIEQERKQHPGSSLDSSASVVIARVFEEHKRVLFNGNGYSEEWKKEAEKRGLMNLRTLPEAVKQMSSDKNVTLFESLGVLSSKELQVQQHTLYEIFSKTIAIESDCLLNMASSYILPVAFEYKKSISAAVDPSVKGPQSTYLQNLSDIISKLITSIEEQKVIQQKAKLFHSEEQAHEQCCFYRNEVMDAMAKTRGLCDELEKIVDDRIWPFPKYSDMLFLK